MGSTALNDWQTQPRDPATGQFRERGGDYRPRDKTIKIRLTAGELRKIRHAAASAEKTLTAYIVQACLDNQPRRTRAPEVTPHQRRLAERLPQNRRRF